jgi:hypothetical protein
MMKDVNGTGLVVTAVSVGGVGAFLWSRQMARWNRQIQKLVDRQVTQAWIARDPSKPLPPFPKLANGSSSSEALPSVSPEIRPAPKTFDAVLATYGQGIPVPFLRALALHESNMDPRLATGPAWGLLQVIDVVREDFNVRNRSRYTRQDLLDPTVNVTIAATALATMTQSYATNHPQSRHLLRDWRNPQFVALLAYGWVAGYSERAGVGRVATYLEQRGLEVTIASVFDAARPAGASEHLSRPDKLAFAKRVARQYFRELQDDTQPGVATTEIQMPPEFVGHAEAGEIEMPPEFVGHVEPGEIEMPPEFVGHASSPAPMQAAAGSPMTVPAGHPDMTPAPVMSMDAGGVHPPEHTNVIIADKPSPGATIADPQTGAGAAPTAAPAGSAVPSMVGGGALSVAMQPSGGRGPVDPYSPSGALVGFAPAGGRHA